MAVSSMEDMTMDLRARLAHLARSPRLLVACDYDGTLAPIVDDPAKAFPRRETVVALRAIAELPQTTVAVISGRALRDLATLSRLPEEIRLVGSHGGEFDVDFVRDLDGDRRVLLDQIIAGAHTIAADYPGAYIEPKPAGLAFHTRRFSGAGALEAVERVTRLAEDRDGVRVRHGHQVIELSGIVCILFTGMFTRHYAHPNLSVEGQVRGSAACTSHVHPSRPSGPRSVRPP